MQEEGTLEKESKKQASRLKRELRKLKSNLGGIREMTRLPGAVVVVDVTKEYLALREAKKLGITAIGIIDTDSNPDTVDVAIPANDDSIRAIDLILNELADAVAIGKTVVSTRREPKQRPKRVRSRRPALARADAAEAETVPVSTGQESRQQAPMGQTMEPGSQEGATEQVPKGQTEPEQSTS
jgi:small subunit ribosomal protein S2